MLAEVIETIGQIFATYVEAKKGDKLAVICLALIGIVIVGGIVFLIINL